MTWRVALQMDPPERLNPAGDSTILLALEAQRRGHALWWYPAGSLCWREGVLWTQHARRIRFFDDTSRWFEQDAPETLGLNEMDVVLMRQDPPFDMGYLTATYLLERIHPRTWVANDPFHVRNAPEKLLPLLFADAMPPTLISHDAAAIRTFLAEQGDIVVKPLYGYGGHAVFRLNGQSGNVEAILETLLAQPEPLVAQRFLPEVTEGDRRVVMIDGQVAGLLGRLPAAGEIRANLRVGGTAAQAALTPRQQDICARLGPALQARGILLAGVDFIGDWLTEINITSPTGLRALKQLYGTAPEADFWDAVARRRAA
jgi:glutathione synthase